MLTHRPVAVALGALGACGAAAGGGLLLQSHILGFAVWPASGPPPDVPAIAVPRVKPVLNVEAAVSQRAATRRRAHGSGERERRSALPSSVMVTTRVGALGAPSGSGHVLVLPPTVGRPAAPTTAAPIPIGSTPQHVEAPITVVERHPIAADASPWPPSTPGSPAPAPSTPLEPAESHTADRPGAAGPRLVGTPAEHAPAADLEPVRSAADNAPAPTDPVGDPGVDGRPSSPAPITDEPKPAPAPEPEPVPVPEPADPAPPADPEPPVEGPSFGPQDVAGTTPPAPVDGADATSMDASGTDAPSPDAPVTATSSASVG